MVHMYPTFIRVTFSLLVNSGSQNIQDGAPSHAMQAQMPVNTVKTLRQALTCTSDYSCFHAVAIRQNTDGANSLSRSSSCVSVHSAAQWAEVVGNSQKAFATTALSV